MFLRQSLTLAACLLALSSPVWAAPAHTYDFGQPAPAAKATRSIEVVMGDMSFDPKAIQIKAGETVRFVLVNKGQLLHEFVIGTQNENAKHAELMMKFPGMEHDEPYMAHVPAGKRSDITWTFNRAGDFEFACLLPGHFDAGMRGTIRVTPLA